MNCNISHLVGFLHTKQFINLFKLDLHESWWFCFTGVPSNISFHFCMPGDHSSSSFTSSFKFKENQWCKVKLSQSQFSPWFVWKPGKTPIIVWFQPWTRNCIGFSQKIVSNWLLFAPCIQAALKLEVGGKCNGSLPSSINWAPSIQDRPPERRCFVGLGSALVCLRYLP